jgi:RNA 2',3'-cyclic 3'-phosphodiesterase
LLRLFFALWPDASTAAQLTRVAGRLSLDSPGRLVGPENYHVTLAFIGEVPASRLVQLQQIGSELRAPHFTMAFNSLELWPGSGAVVAVVPDIAPALHSLWCQLHEASGLARSRFRPHVTLARKVAQAPVLQAMSTITWRASSFSLARSDTGGAESAYTVLDTWPLLYET